MSLTLKAGLAYWQSRTGEQGACHDERRAYLRFCDRHGLPPTPDATALYLVHLHEKRPRSAPALRYRLRQLDLAAALAGEPLHGDDAGLRRFMLGLHRALADGSDHGRAPLYLEDVHALLQAVDRDRGAQLRDAAFVLLVAATAIPVDQLRQLRWHQVRLRRRALEVNVPLLHRGRGERGRVVVAERPGPTCPVQALRAWSREATVGNGYVFTSRDDAPMGMVRAAQLLHPLPDRTATRWNYDASPVPRAALSRHVDALLAPSLRQHRDRALLLLAFAACLTTDEARDLRVGDARAHRDGLLLHAPGRVAAVGVPRGRTPGRCPVQAWERWRERYREVADAGDGAPAFPSVRKNHTSGQRLKDDGPSRIVRLRCAEAGLTGDYSFSSLRIGFIRTAARAGVPEQLICKQSGLRSLDSVLLHVRRERLVSHSAASMVGL